MILWHRVTSSCKNNSKRLLHTVISNTKLDMKQSMTIVQLYNPSLSGPLSHFPFTLISLHNQSQNMASIFPFKLLLFTVSCSLFPLYHASLFKSIKSKNDKIQLSFDVWTPFVVHVTCRDTWYVHYCLPPHITCIMKRRQFYKQENKYLMKIQSHLMPIYTKSIIKMYLKEGRKKSQLLKNFWSQNYDVCWTFVESSFICW